jgi:signal transduction histidine kinase
MDTVGAEPGKGMPVPHAEGVPESLAGAQPLHQTMSRLAAAIRGALAVIAVPVALLGAAPPVSAVWLTVALAGLAAWTSIYCYVALVRGLTSWLVACDVLVAIGLCLSTRYLVAPAAVPGISSWVSNVASLTVICGQFAGTPLLSVPAGLAVTAGFVAGSSLAGAPDHGQAGATGLILQTFITAGIIAVGTRAARTAGAAFTRYHESVRVARVREAERADERHQLRHLHNGPLTTLTMAGLGDLGERAQAVQRRAATDVAALWRASVDLPSDSAAIARSPAVPLDERLHRVAAGYRPPLRLAITVPQCLVPAPVADGFAEGVGEALENVVRHAGVREASVALRELNGYVIVTVEDTGRGFNPGTVPSYRFGLRHGLGLLADAGGRTRVRSAPGQGTRVTLEWPRG